MKDNQSAVLYEQACKVMPGGVNSPVRAFGSVGRTPLFISRAKGSKIYDEDNNEFVDYVCSWGPAILGHAREEVIDVVTKAARDGLTYGAPTKREVQLAELIAEIMPSMEMLRLVSSGTEAVMSAIRAARGYTGKDMIIKFRGCYHGHSDGLLVKAGSAALTQSQPDSAGVPKAYSENTLIAEFNHKESVEELFEKYKGKIAGIVVEPVAANMGVVLPQENFLHFLREITLENDALLIFDEVITGFRLSIGGAQAYYGIKPDLTTLGKIVGGGMPIGAYGGRKDIMEMISPLGPVYQAGTLSGNPVATAAGLKTLEILKANPQYYSEMKEKAEYLANTFREYGTHSGEAVHVNQVGSLLSAFFTEKQVTDFESANSSDTKKYAVYFNRLLEQGIYVAPSQYEAMFVSAAHSWEEVKRTAEIIKGKL